MPKSKHRHREIPRGTPPLPGLHLALGYDPKGKMEPVDVAMAKEGWSEYTLADGSVIRSKALLIDVKHAVGQYNGEGEPVYLMNYTIVTQLKPPEHLKKKA